ncbi:MAG: hypothetical protein KJ063_03200 [Anaerolineae bacterium]|nr:hypothetical protein [Anaerolineae bacterium]
MMKKQVLFFTLLLVLLVACGAADGTGQLEGYPADPSSAASQSGSGYPAPNVAPTSAPAGAYPAPDEAPIAVDQPRFQFDTVLVAGMMNVTGQSPANLPLAVVDITYNGVVLGTGSSDADGRFSIPVTPLPEGHRVGLMIADLQGRTLDEMAEAFFPYRGENFMNIPNVGIFFETSMVQP